MPQRTILLTPVVPLSNAKFYKIGVDEPPKDVHILGDLKVSQSFGTVCFYIQPLKFPNTKSPEKIEILSPFFYINKTEKSDEANLEAIQLECGGFVFKCFRYSRDVKKHEPLCYYGKEDSYVPFSSCVAVEKVGEAKRRRLTGNSIWTESA